MATADDLGGRISDVLHEAAETHHAVYRITDGVDADWASWYSDWLVNLSVLPNLLGAKPVRSALTHLLVTLDGEFVATDSGGRWEDHYARGLLSHFSPAARPSP